MYRQQNISYNFSSPFGVTLNARDFTSEDYRYGFNGMEKDDEVKWNGNSYDFGARIYDNRLGRFLSIDPHYLKFPAISPYVFSFNSPNLFNDKTGLDGKVTVQKNPNGGGEIIISAVVYITGKGADSKEAEYLTTRASKMYQTKTIKGDDGAEWTVKFNIQFKYDDQKTVTNLQDGENIIVSSDNIGRSHVKGAYETFRHTTDFYNGANLVEATVTPIVGNKINLDSKDLSGASSIVVLHEVFHLLGFIDRYKDVKTADGNIKSKPDTGFEYDLMGNTNVGTDLVDQHYQNIVKTYGILESGSYKIKYYVDREGVKQTGFYIPSGEDEDMGVEIYREIAPSVGTPEKIETTEDE